MREERKCQGSGDSTGDQGSGGRAEGENQAVVRK